MIRLFAAWFGIAFVFYLTMSVAELGQFNPIKWHVLTRVIYGVMLTWLTSEVIAAALQREPTDDPR